MDSVCLNLTFPTYDAKFFIRDQSLPVSTAYIENGKNLVKRKTKYLVISMNWN